MKILITGCAGFIGFNLAKALLEKNFFVLGIDNYDNYYSIKLKKKRVLALKRFKNFKFMKIDITNKSLLKKNLEKKKIDTIIHLAAQAGVRYSMVNPQKYINSNILGFVNVIELSKMLKIKKLIYASSSSVYGDSKNFPVNEKLSINPKNIYALSKKINEDLASNYSSLYNIPMIGLRFFTVYGEWGRPDMFMMKYLDASKNKKKFFLNNFGYHERDFTYISDVTYLLSKLINKKFYKQHDIFNICSNTPVNLKTIISYLSKKIKPPKIIKIQLQKADVIKTHGDNKKILNFLNLKSYKFTNINTGLNKTFDWFAKVKFKI